MSIYPKFTIGTMVCKNGKLVVRIRVSYNGERVDLYTGITLDKNQWNSKLRKVKQGCFVNGIGYNVLNSKIEDEISFVNKYINDTLLRQDNLSLSTLKTRFNANFKDSSGMQSKEFFFQLNQYIESTSVSHSWSDQYKQEWGRVAKSLFEYKSNMNFSDLTDSILNGYLKYLSVTMYNDKIIKNLQKIKEFAKWAANKNYPVNQDLFSYNPKLYTSRNDVQYLEVEELKKIIELDLSSNEIMDNVRDLFVFQCFTALRFGDLKKLKKNDIFQKDNRYYIKLLTQKDKAVVEYPLSKYAEKIYLKYKDKDYNDGRMFYVMSNPKYNLHLKKLGQLADLKGCWVNRRYKLSAYEEEKIPHSDLTAHIPRRTFVSLCFNSGVPEGLIAQITSHSDVSAMKPYIGVSKAGKSMVINSLNDLFK